MAIAGIAAAAIVVASSSQDPTVAGLVWIAVLAGVPGWVLAAWLVPREDTDLVERAVAGIGLGVLAATLVMLLLAYARTPTSPWIVAVPLVGVSLLLAARGDVVPRCAPRDGAMLGSVLLLASVFRLPNLAYNEFQGDEVEVVLRAVGVTQGGPEALFLHGKGPAEILVVALVHGASGVLTEASARAVFAAASLASVAIVFAWLRRIAGRLAAFVGGLMIATNGYFVAFAHIAQYQSLVLLWSLLSVWSACRWADAPHERRWTVLSALFASAAALAHFDAIFVLPPIAVIALRHGLNAPALFGWIRAGAVGIVTLGAFFIPYLFSPAWTAITDRFQDRVGPIAPRANFGGLLDSAVLYDSWVFLALVGVLAVAGWLLARGGDRGRLALVTLAWFIVPLAFYAIVARKPGTHIHVVTTPAIMAAALGAALLWARATRPVTKGAMAIVFVCGMGAAAFYVMQAYVQTLPELVRGGQIARSPLFWSRSTSVPRKERFGFPYEAGWKAVGVLFADGRLNGSYDSNENPQVTHWYTRDAWRCTDEPRYYVIAEGVQDEIEPPRRRIAADYGPRYVVTVAGQPKIRIHERGSTVPAESVAIESMVDHFDRTLTTPSIDPGVWARGPHSPRMVASPVQFGSSARLIGYRLFPDEPWPGGRTRIDLYWLPLVSSNGAHVIELWAGTVGTIADGNGPGCDRSRDATEWGAGRPFVQRASIKIDPAAQLGRHPIRVAIANPARIAPATELPVADNAVTIGTLEVKRRG
jgi:hypothetical protein